MNKHSQKNKKYYLPFVSVCTPTFNRRPFIKNMFEMFKNQTYPKNRMEWVIVDDGTDKIKDLVVSSDITQIKYVEVEKKMSLGAKRNYMHTFCKGSIIVYWDDDDYYCPERISHAVDKLTENPDALCAGSSELYVYFKNLEQKNQDGTVSYVNKMIQCGPYGPNHSTAGTFAFRKDLLNITRYNDNAALAEEKEFLKNYTIPFVQLDPMKAILVFSHEHNTFDKRKLLQNPNPHFLKESDKTVDMFIRKEHESAIKKFFTEDIDTELVKYKPGEPNMKPDVLAQIKVIEKEREQMIKEAMLMNSQNGGGGSGGIKIMMEIPGKPPKELTQEEIVSLLQQQKQNIEYLTKHNAELENSLKKMQLILLEKMKEIQNLRGDT
jgi:glycosyltransferase involved in cell wall biosynthesis